MSIGTGAKSAVTIGEETTFATEAEVKYKVPFTSESLNHSVETNQSEALLGNRAVKSLAPGKEGAEGSIDLEAYPGIMGFLFYLALGKSVAYDSNSDSTDDSTKIIPIGITEDLPSATIEVDHSGNKIKYTGMTVNSLSFSGAVGDIPTMSVDFTGKEEIIGAATVSSTLVEPGEDPYYFKELTLYNDEFTTVADLYSSIDIEINNNIDADDYRLDGTGKRKSVTANKLEVTGSVNIYFDSSVLTNEYSKYKNFEDAKIGIKLVKDTGEELQIFLPRIKFTEMPHDIGGADKISLNANFTSITPALGDVIEVVDKTNDTGTY